MNKVVALVRSETGADVWWRTLRPFTHLQRAGYDAKWCWVDSDEKPTLDIEGATVILQKTLVMNGNIESGPRWVQKLRDLGVSRIVFEADDDIVSEGFIEFMRDAGRLSPAVQARLDDERERQILLINACDRVIVSNGHLKSAFRDYTKVKDIRVVPNFIDVDWFVEHLKPQDTSVVTIGWAGGLRPEYNFTAMAEAWGVIAERYKDVRFVVGGWQPNIIYEKVPLERIDRRAWRPFNEWPTTMQVTIGCCPLSNTQFNLCKSPIKLFEYTCAGAAVIASTPLYGPFIDGRNGLVADSKDEWVDHLTYMIEHPVYRMNAQAKMFNHISHFYNLKTEYRVLRDALQ